MRLLLVMCCRDRVTGNGCPVCAGRCPCRCSSLAAMRPALSEQWDRVKNEIMPTDVRPRSGYKAWWLCTEHAPPHSWQVPSRMRQLARELLYQRQRLSSQTMADSVMLVPAASNAAGPIQGFALPPHQHACAQPMHVCMLPLCLTRHEHAHALRPSRRPPLSAH